MGKYEFRAKSKTYGKWLYGVPYYSGELWWLMVDDNTCSDEFGTGSYNIIPETVGQYTGLKDKNGVKIFEGDIVRDKWNCYTPIFQNGIYMAFNVDYLHLKKQEPSTQFNVIWRNGCEIIGNIHDNPELLEVLGNE